MGLNLVSYSPNAFPLRGFGSHPRSFDASEPPPSHQRQPVKQPSTRYQPTIIFIFYFFLVKSEFMVQQQHTLLFLADARKCIFDFDLISGGSWNWNTHSTTYSIQKNIEKIIIPNGNTNHWSVNIIVFFSLCSDCWLFVGMGVGRY